MQPSANFGVYGVGSVDFSPDGARLATAGIDADALVIIWDIASGEQLATLAGHKLSVNDVRFSPDGSMIATTSEDGETRLWDAGSSQELVVIDAPSSVLSGDFSPDGQLIVTGEAGKEGDQGTFETTYVFTAKYEDCSTLSGPIFGSCQHPVVAGSGTGDYKGVTGRFRMIDDAEAGNIPYKGHLQFG